MVLKFYNSPVHVNHNNDVANENAKKIDLSIIVKDALHEAERINNELFNQALSSYEEDQKTKEHLKVKEVSEFLRSGKPGNLPGYHN